MTILSLFGCTEQGSANSDSKMSNLSQNKEIHPETSFSLAQVGRVMGDPDGKFDHYFQDNSVATEAAEFSSTGNSFASVSKSKNSQAAITLWDAQSLQIIWQKRQGGETECLGFSKNDTFIVTGGENLQGKGALKAFDTKSGDLIWSAPTDLYPKSIESMRFSPDASRLLTGDENGLVILWDTSAESPNEWFVLGMVDVKADEDSLADVNQLDWTADSRYFVTGERDGDVHLYDSSAFSMEAKPKPLRRFEGFAGHSVKSVRISPNNRFVAAGAGGMQGLRVWQLDDATLISHIPSEPAPDASTGMSLNAERYEAVAFTNDSQYLIVGGTWPSWWFEQNGRDNQFFNVPIDVFAIKYGHSNSISIEHAHKHHLWRTEYFAMHPKAPFMISSHDDGSIGVWEMLTLSK